MPTIQDEDSSQATFQRLKAHCVPLLANSLLIPSSTPTVSKLLSEVITILRETRGSGNALKPSIITYVFFPLSSILRRNTLSSIPDQILEKVLVILSTICEDWWWEFDETTWEQICMLCSAILGGIDSKGKGKVRDDETKEAATRCLWILLRERTAEEDPSNTAIPSRATRIFSRFQSHARTPTFIPVIGQTVNSLLIAAESSHTSLQRSSLQVLHVIVEHYLADGFVPSILPGVVSTTSKIALGVGASKGWANGEIVAAALLVMRSVIVKSVGDDVCVRDGAIQNIDSLEDLADLVDPLEPKPAPNSGRTPYMTARTPAWLRGSGTQLHIAMNALTPLVNHPTPSALLGLCDFSETVLSATTLTIPQSQPLLLSFLLSLSCSAYDSVSEKAGSDLRRLLAPSSSARHALLQVLMQISRDNLAALPRLIPTHSDAKVEHAAGILESVCSLAVAQESAEGSRISAIAVGVGKLLGPNGGIEKWGWSLLSVLEFVDNPISVTRSSATQLLLENDAAAADEVTFPELTLRHVTSRSAHIAIERMLRAMGLAAGEDCIFAVEWFLNAGRSGRGCRAVAALWCTCRLLEGAGRISLNNHEVAASGMFRARSKRVEKLARNIARQIADLWSDVDEDWPEEKANVAAPLTEEGAIVEHVKGLLTIRATPDYEPSSGPRKSPVQPMLHRALSLQLLSITAGILEARFTPLLLHTLYPVLHSVVSQSSLLSNTAFATLNYITRSTSYASPANMLLSNFDYALDAVSRRLSRRWLDLDATKVLVVLVRLVGRDVVQKAGDVVEECFDRLDEYHGYEMLVDGLVEVLSEVVKVMEDQDDSRPQHHSRADNLPADMSDGEKFGEFLEWYAHRHDKPDEHESLRDNSYPRDAWGSKSEADGEQENSSPIPDPNAEPSPSPSQILTKQIVSRSLFFLTHGSPIIRARILMLLSAAVPVLPESALLPSVHHAWPFILNRFADRENFVVSAAASLVESLATHVGDFMHQRVWDDIWPRFRTILQKLSAADTTNALACRGNGAVGTESAYTYSHRLYRSVLRTMSAAVVGVQPQDLAVWEVVLLFRRFLHSHAHDELQACARDLYTAIAKNNADAVWLAMSATQGQIDASTAFLAQKSWDIDANVALIFKHDS